MAQGEARKSEGRDRGGRVALEEACDEAVAGTGELRVCTVGRSVCASQDSLLPALHSLRAVGFILLTSL